MIEVATCNGTKTEVVDVFYSFNAVCEQYNDVECIERYSDSIITVWIK